MTGGQGERLEQELETLRIRGGPQGQEVARLKRRLEHATASEQQALDEISTVTRRFAAEKLALQKTVAQLQADVRVVEQSMIEWQRRALDSDAQLRALTRQSNLEVWAFRHELMWVGVRLMLFAVDPALARRAERGRWSEGRGTSISGGPPSDSWLTCSLCSSPATEKLNTR